VNQAIFRAKQMPKQIPGELAGVFAALPTPFGPEGDPLWEALDALVDFSLAHGMKGLCLGGGTGEYAACSVAHRVEMFARVAGRVNGKAHLICAVGGEHAGQVRQLAVAAARSGAIALLFPPPMFLPFAQDDLVDFMAQVSSDLPLPVLLYNIPQCTRDLGMANILSLIAKVSNIIGVKDSSGNIANLAAIGQVNAHTPLAFLVGNDELLLEALEHGARGVISGTAGACPELVLPVYEAWRAGRADQARALRARLSDFIFHTRALPSPWAVKLALQVRGLEMGPMAWPMGPSLRQEAQAFQDWFAGQIAAREAPARTPDLRLATSD
jgi:4-hydroxy-tetrahydrodipicolinate synthase